MSTPRTLSQKVWDRHLVRSGDCQPGLSLYIDLHLVHEVTSLQAFDGPRLAGRTVRRPDLTVATMDHNVPTGAPDPGGRRACIDDPVSARQMQVLRANCDEFGIACYGIGDLNQGIVHIIGPEQGLTQPGMTVVCGDSHTSTHGAFGALASASAPARSSTSSPPRPSPSSARHHGRHRRGRPPGRRHRART